MDRAALPMPQLPQVRERPEQPAAEMAAAVEPAELAEEADGAPVALLAGMPATPPSNIKKSGPSLLVAAEDEAPEPRRWTCPATWCSPATDTSSTRPTPIPIRGSTSKGRSSSSPDCRLKWPPNRPLLVDGADAVAVVVGAANTAPDPLGTPCTDYFTPEQYAAKNGALAVVSIANFQQLAALSNPDARIRRWRRTRRRSPRTELRDSEIPGGPNLPRGACGHRRHGTY